jgi:hypothetical protein
MWSRIFIASRLVFLSAPLNCDLSVFIDVEILAE